MELRPPSARSSASEDSEGDVEAPKEDKDLDLVGFRGKYFRDVNASQALVRTWGRSVYQAATSEAVAFCLAEEGEVLLCGASTTFDSINPLTSRWRLSAKTLRLLVCSQEGRRFGG